MPNSIWALGRLRVKIRPEAFFMLKILIISEAFKNQNFRAQGTLRFAPILTKNFHSRQF